MNVCILENEARLALTDADDPLAPFIALADSLHARAPRVMFHGKRLIARPGGDGLGALEFLGMGDNGFETHDVTCLAAQAIAEAMVDATFGRHGGEGWYDFISIAADIRARDTGDGDAETLAAAIEDAGYKA